MMTDEDMPEALHNWLLCQSKDKLMEIMFEALELMQGYNGRSLRYCIATAAGFEENGKGGWKIPKMTPPIVPGGSYWLNIAKSDNHTIREKTYRLRDEALPPSTQVELLSDILCHCNSVDQRIKEHEENVK